MGLDRRQQLLSALRRRLIACCPAAICARARSGEPRPTKHPLLVLCQLAWGEKSEQTNRQDGERGRLPRQQLSLEIGERLASFDEVGGGRSAGAALESMGRPVAGRVAHLI